MKPDSGQSEENLRAELDALRRENAGLRLYRDTVERANSIILRWTPEGTIIFCNDYGLRFFGYGLEELAGRNVMGSIVPETEQTGRDLLAMISAILRAPGNFMVNENENIRKDGSRAWISWSNRAVTDPAGKFVEILSIGHEVTERKTSELRLENEHLFLQQILDAIPVPVYYKNARGVFLGCNRAFEKHMGVPAERIIGGVAQDVAKPEPAAFHTGLDAELLRDGRPQIYDYTDTAPSGKERTTLFEKTVFRDAAGNIAGLVGAAVDITERKQTERRLKHEHHFLGQLIDAIPVPIFYKDTDGVFTGCNRAYAEYLGAPRERIIGSVIAHLAPEETAAHHAARDTELFREGILQSYDYTDTAPSGKERWTLFSKTVFRDTEGNVSGLVGAAIDITARKQLEQRLEHEHHLVAELLDAIPVPIFYKDPTGVFLGCNRAYEKYLGAPRDRIIGKTIADLAPKVTASFHTRQDRELFAEGSLQAYDFTDTDPSGKERSMLFAKTLFHDTGGKVAGLLGAAVDITERKRMERELRESESRLLAILERIPSGIFLIDAADHTITMMNTAAREMTGAEKGECLGKVCYETVCAAPPGECPVTDLGLHLENAERVLVGHDGRRIPVLKTVVPLQLGGRDFLLESVLDISVRKEAEENRVRAEKLSAAVELAGAASHELNQPLQIISGNAQLLSLFAEDAGKRDAAIAEILSQVSRMADLLRRLIHITHYETTPYAGESRIMDIRRSSE